MFFKGKSKKPGQSPGTLVYVGENREDDVKISVIDYDPDHLEEKEVQTFDECVTYKDKETVTWIDVSGIHDMGLIESLGKRFDFHPLLLEDIVNTQHRPKLDDYEDHLFIVMKMLHDPEEGQLIKHEHISIILTSKVVISLQEYEGDIFDPVRERIRKKKGRIRNKGTDYLTYALIDTLVDYYFKVFETVGEKIEALQEEALDRPRPDILNEIHALRREMIFLRKSVWPLREIIISLTRGDSKLISDNTVLFFRDVYDHTIQVIDTIESFRDMISGLQDIYLSSVSNRMNEVMKVLTIIATIFIPMTFLAGIYGMNFKFMPELEWPWAYPALWVVLITIFVTMVLWFKKKRWLSFLYPQGGIMTDSMSIFQKLGQWFQQAGTGNELWRFVAALAVLIIGLIILEILFQSAKRRIHRFMEQKALSPDLWRLPAILPPARLAGTAILLRIAEFFIQLPAGLAALIHGVEGLILALAVMLIGFQLINLVDRLSKTLPTTVHEEGPKPAASKLKGALRISIIIIVIAGFIYTQRDLFPPWLWQYAWWRYLLVLVVINLTIILIRLSDKFFSGFLIDLKDVEEKARQLFILRSTIWPIRLLLITIALYTFKEIIPLPSAFERISEHTIGVLSTLAVVVFLYRLVDLVAHELTRVAQREDNLLDQTFVQMIRYFARLIVGVVGAVYIIKALSGKPMSALLAGLGIGGLAVALAAQDTLKNFFGSIMIMLDKPFDVGQRVTVDGYDGTVENIGFRSTRVRTLTGHLVTVPNEKMASSNIENIGRRPSIRRLTNITITYDTPPDKVEKAVATVRGILENHEGMLPDFLPRVYFNEFNSDSLNIIMLYWYHPPDYWKFLEFNERTNLQIMRAFEAEGIEFAFPTTTTYLAHDDRRPLHVRFSGDTVLSEQDSGQYVQPPKEQP